MRWFHYKRPVLVLAVSLTLLAGGWYARVHYWLPRKSLEEAELALKQRDFERARLELEKCLLAWPKDPHVYFLLARTAQRAHDLDQAERSFRAALSIAREQGTKGFELRAATSLARLLADDGRREEARQLLAPVYGWFTEGFGTPVLQEAKALLAELA